MSLAADYLRQLGMPDEQITKVQAELDQATAEVDHLIDHAVRLTRGTVTEAAIQGLAIRSHIEGKTRDEQHRLLSALIVRAGQLASSVETLIQERDALKTALAAAQEGQA